MNAIVITYIGYLTIPVKPPVYAGWNQPDQEVG